MLAGDRTYPSAGWMKCCSPESYCYPPFSSFQPFSVQVSSLLCHLHQDSQEPRIVMRAVLDKQEWACPHPDANTDSKHWIWCQLGFMHRLGKAQTPNSASLSRLDPDRVGLALVLVTWHKQINSEPQIKNSLLLQVLSSAKPFQTHMVLNTLKLKHFQTDT